MSETALNVQTRKESGKEVAKRIRREGWIPGVYYFHGKEATPLMINKSELFQFLHDQSGLVTINIDGKDTKKCIIRDLQMDPILQEPIHVDLMGVDLKEKIQLTVYVHLTGEPKGVVDEGGILNQNLRELEIECLPTDIPEYIVVDVSHLDINESVLVSEVEQDKFVILGEPERSIATVTPPTLEEELEEGEEEEELEEPEVISRGGEEEEEGEEEE
jgi:large subunit ribosomal protein L25